MYAGSREEETVNWCEYREGVVKYCLKEQVNILGMIATGEEGTHGQLYCVLCTPETRRLETSALE